jgi:hypothetical protein
MDEIQQGLGLLIPQASYDYASDALGCRDGELLALKAFEDSETQRMHYVIAREHWRAELAKKREGAMGCIAIDLVNGKALNTTTEILMNEGTI